jgi:hypothetical protein
MIVDLQIINAVHAETSCLQKQCPTLVMRNLLRVTMRKTVHFNDKAVLVIDEVYDVRSDGHLPIKFQTTQTPIAQRTPSYAFSVGWLVAHALGARVGEGGGMFHVCKTEETVKSVAE